MALVTWLSAGGTEAERGLTHRSPTVRSAFFISAGFIPRFTRLPARGLVVRPDSLGDLRAGLQPTRLCDWLAPQAEAPAICRSPLPLCPPRAAAPSGPMAGQALWLWCPANRPHEGAAAPSTSARGPVQAHPTLTPVKAGWTQNPSCFFILTALRAPHTAGGTEPLLKNPPRHWRLGHRRLGTPGRRVSQHRLSRTLWLV